MQTDSNDVKAKMKSFIEDICSTIGPRLPTSSAESEAATFLQKRFEQYGETGIEHFACHPGAYNAAFRLPLLLYILAVVLYWFLPVASLLLLISAVVVFVGNTMYTKEIIDVLFPEKQSTNVICKIKPRGKTENLVIMSGHHDSNWEAPLFRKHPGISFFMGVHFVLVALLMLVLIIKFLLAAFSISFSYTLDLTLLVVFAAFIPLEIYTYINVISDRPVMGANDNLSALAVCLGVADHLSDPENLPENTEVWLCSFGCEEIGIRGARRFVATHYDEIKGASVVNLDIVGGKDDQLHIVTKEEIVVSESSEEMVEVLEKIFSDLSIKSGKGPVAFFTNSMAFVERGIKSVAVSSTYHGGLTRYQHTLEDTPDKLDYDLMEDCLEVCNEYIKRIDSAKLH
jgi:hypothetical protein